MKHKWTQKQRLMLFYLKSKEVQKALGINANAVKCQINCCKRNAEKAGLTVVKWINSQEDAK